MVENPTPVDATEHPPGTDFNKLKAGDVPLVPDPEGGWTVPEEDQRTHLPLDSSFVAHGRSRRRIHPLLQFFELIRG
jgi:hypothetical protein